MITLLCVGSLLTLCSYTDIRRKEISVSLLLLYGIPKVILLLLKPQQAVLMIITAILPGIILLFISKITKESIGYGDGLLLIVTGIYLGWEQNLVMLFAGLFSASIFSVVYVFIKKGKRSIRIPFVPFLTIGFLILILGRY